MDLHRVFKVAAWLLAGIGTAMVLMALVPLGTANSNIGFWVAAIGFDRLASVIPESADLWLAATGFGALAIAAAMFLIPFLARSEISFRREPRRRRGGIEQKLIGAKWVLTYDPEKNLSKELSFNADGTIGEGRNNNEHRWAVSGKYLEIYRQSGLLHNRFEFHESGERLNFVRDPKAMGTKGQYIRRAA